MSWFQRWRDKRADESWEKWKRIHRWDALADYNGRVMQGIVHTPEYVADMARQQARFNAEHGIEAPPPPRKPDDPR